MPSTHYTHPNYNINMAKKSKNSKLKSVLESVLLVAEKPVSARELSNVSGAMLSEIQKSLAELIENYKDHGMKIIKKGDYYSLVTDPQNAEAVARFLNEELRHDLSEPALETLSIITYKQPVTRIDIEEVRGVSSDQILRNLMIRGLIAEVGRKETPGRPILYGATMEFLQYFGFKSEQEIPQFEAPESKSTNPELFKNIDTISNEKQ